MSTAVVYKLAKNASGTGMHVQRFHRKGRVQNQFKVQYGEPSGACVRQAFEADANRIGDLTQLEVQQKVENCARPKADLEGTFIHGKTDEARRARARRRSKVLSRTGRRGIPRIPGM